MKNVFIIIFILGASLSGFSLVSENSLPPSHPLNHKDFRIIDRPQSNWVPGLINLNQVVGYILKTKEEAKVAVEKLKEAGYGKTGIEFIYIPMEKNKIVINDNIITSREAAIKYIQDNKIEKLLYLEEDDSFPKAIPVWLSKLEGTKFWLKDWRK